MTQIFSYQIFSTQIFSNLRYPSHADSKNAVVVNSLVEVKFTQLQCKFSQSWQLLN